MSYWDVTVEVDEPTEGEVYVRGPYDKLVHHQRRVCEAFEVGYQQGYPPEEFTFNHPIEGAITYRRTTDGNEQH